jgi:hypothetical protein
VPVPGAAGNVLALRTAQLSDILIEHGSHDLQARADSERQQALLRRPGDLSHRHDDLFRDGDLRNRRVRLRAAAVLLIGLAHAGSLLRVFLVRSPVAYHPAGSRWGTATLNFYEDRDNLYRHDGRI